MEIIITAPSLDTRENVSGVSSVVRFIIGSNTSRRYVHFQIGRRDTDGGGFSRIVTTAKTLWRWRTLLRSHPAALVHYSFPLSAPSILRDPLFMLMALRRGHAMVVHIHGGLFLTAPHTPWLLRRVLRWVFSWPVPFIVLGDEERRTIMERYGARDVTVLPNCPDLSLAKLFTRRATPATTPLTLGYLGRIEPEKGMAELIAACRELTAAGVPFRLRIAGKEEKEGEWLPQFSQAMGENFEYVGLVAGKEKDAFLRSLDVFVLPSHFEGLPMSLLESMSYGVVPVVTAVGSIPQVVGGERPNGILVPPRNVPQLAAALQHLAADRTALADMSQRARDTIMTRFSPSEYVCRLNAIYDTCRAANDEPQSNHKPSNHVQK